MRLAELIEFPATSGPAPHQRIIDARGRVVLDDADDIPEPVHSFRAPVVVEGEVAAWLEMKTSLRPLLVSTVWVAAASSLLGLLAWFMVRLFPLRVLDRTLAELSLQSAQFQAALDNMARGLCLFDAQGGLTLHNHRFAAMFGAPSAGATAATLMADTRAAVMFDPPDPAQ